MPQFTVYLTTTATATVTVEAEDYDDAIEKAYDEAPRSICAQCSGWGEDWNKDEGEYEATSVVDENDEEVWAAKVTR